MLSLIVLITAALLTSSCAVSLPPRSVTGRTRKKKVRNLSLWRICAGILALGSVLLAVHIQHGMLQ
jgi:hypothetical protein